MPELPPDDRTTEQQREDQRAFGNCPDCGTPLTAERSVEQIAYRGFVYVNALICPGCWRHFEAE